MSIITKVRHSRNGSSPEAPPEVVIPELVDGQPHPRPSLRERARNRWADVPQYRKEQYARTAGAVVGVIAYIGWVSWIIHKAQENQPDIVYFGYRQD